MSPSHYCEALHDHAKTKDIMSFSVSPGYCLNATSYIYCTIRPKIEKSQLSAVVSAILSLHDVVQFKAWKCYTNSNVYQVTGLCSRLEIGVSNHNLGVRQKQTYYVLLYPDLEGTVPFKNDNHCNLSSNTCLNINEQKTDKQKSSFKSNSFHWI